MSAEAAVRGAVIEALRADATLSAELNGVFDGPAVRAHAPCAELGELLSADWGTKDRAGREIRLTLTLHELGERPVRLMTLGGAAEAAVEAMPRDLTGWRVASARFVRARTLGAAPGAWRMVMDFRVRVLAVEEEDGDGGGEG